MRLTSIYINNFRLLKDFNFELENDLSLIIGKNNTGKTSILTILDRFIGESSQKNFSFYDFNSEYLNLLSKRLKGEETSKPKVDGISLRVHIEYDENDDLSKISKLLMDLDPTNNVIALSYEYCIDDLSFQKMKIEYDLFESNERAKQKADPEYLLRTIDEFIEHMYKEYFDYKEKSMDYDKKSNIINLDNFVNLRKENLSLKDVISFKYISARRDVTNRHIDKTLSNQTARIYKKSIGVSEEKDVLIDNFIDVLRDTDVNLSRIYDTLFKDIKSRIKKFGGLRKEESQIEIKSTLQHNNLLDNNTTVVYKNQNRDLPESYNGLGYMNLISMIFEIEILITEFMRTKDKAPAEINLLFIEEPEAHTHPQMQYVFIKNIKDILKERVTSDDNSISMQTIISTHSPHIVADSDFEDIKYLARINSFETISKSMKDLKIKYSQTAQYEFLKQYLTISRAELFFADKAVLIEGDTERILIPTVMKKLDYENAQKYPDSELTPLLSQNISIVEVGAYSQIFDEFIHFLNLKTLLITDIDSVNTEGEKSPVKDSVDYSNSSIKHYMNPTSFTDLKGFKFDKKILAFGEQKWENDSKGNLCIVFQTEENEIIGRSFEESFINVNLKFIIDNIKKFNGVKNPRYFKSENLVPYFLADNCIKKKTHFALDIIYNSMPDYSNWNIPSYIKEGLIWLQKD